MSLLSDQLVATAAAKVASLETKVAKLEAHLGVAVAELKAAAVALAEVKAAPEIPDAYHSGANTVVRAG